MEDFDFHQFIKNTPVSPGIYQFIDSKSQILYVGKAKNLQARVSSYRGSAPSDLIKP